jgi:hypothetical protein
MSSLKPGTPVVYANPHTGCNETGWTYTGPSWKPGRIDLAKTGTPITAQLVDPQRVKAL